MPIRTWDTKARMLFSLLLANIRISSSFFFLFLVILSNFFISTVVKQNIKIKLARAIPIGAPTKLTEEIIHNPLLIAHRKVFYCIILFDWFLGWNNLQSWLFHLVWILFDQAGLFDQFQLPFKQLTIIRHREKKNS